MAPYRLILPNSVEWVEFPPEFAYEFHPGALRGKPRVHVTQKFTNDEMKLQAEKFSKGPINANTLTKQFTTTFETLCIENSVAPIAARVHYDDHRDSNLAKRNHSAPFRHRPGPLVISRNPSLQELYDSVNHDHSAPDEWWALVLAAIEDPNFDENELSRIWKHTNSASTKNLLTNVRRIGTAVNNAKHNVLPIIRSTVEGRNAENIATMVSKMNVRYPPKTAGLARPKTVDASGRSKRGRTPTTTPVTSPATLGRFLQKQNDLQKSTTPKVRNIAALVSFFCPAGNAGVITEGETQETRTRFYNACMAVTFFPLSIQDNIMLEHHLAELMGQWTSMYGKRSGTFLTYLAACIGHIDALLSLTANGQSLSDFKTAAIVAGDEGDETLQVNEQAAVKSSLKRKRSLSAVRRPAVSTAVVKRRGGRQTAASALAASSPRYGGTGSHTTKRGVHVADFYCPGTASTVSMSKLKNTLVQQPYYGRFKGEGDEPDISLILRSTALRLRNARFFLGSATAFKDAFSTFANNPESGETAESLQGLVDFCAKPTNRYIFAKNRIGDKMVVNRFVEWCIWKWLDGPMAYGHFFEGLKSYLERMDWWEEARRE